MLIQSGKVKELEGLPWVAIEMTSEAHTDEVVLHLIQWAVKNLEREGKAFQLLYPVESRTSSGPALFSPYLWMRVSLIQSLSRITSIQGIQGMVSDAEFRTIPVDPVFVEELISRAKSLADGWSDGIGTGSGVRVLLGSGHGLCGIVETIKGEEAEVRIALKSRAVRLKIPVRALKKLRDVPKDYFEKEDL